MPIAVFVAHHSLYCIFNSWLPAMEEKIPSSKILIKELHILYN
jgi:hypothetical protein